MTRGTKLSKGTPFDSFVPSSFPLHTSLLPAIYIAKITSRERMGWYVLDEKSPQTGGAAHRIVLDNRNRLTVSGVDGVESFDETSIVMSTAEGSSSSEANPSTLKN